MIIGIDASNIKQGGGITHLVELLKNVNVSAFAVKKIVVWADENTLRAIPDHVWIHKQKKKITGLFSSLYWQFVGLHKAALKTDCDVLFVPGGSYLGWFTPFVAMSQNMLPFEWGELRRFGFSKVSMRLLLLRYIQIHSFKRAHGMIFLTDYAEQSILKILKLLKGKNTIIPHGIDAGFLKPPRQPREIESYSDQTPLRIVYVSIVDQYKHQWVVAEAISFLRKKNIPVVLQLIGPAYKPAEQRLQKILRQIDPTKSFVHYVGEIPYHQLPNYYASADLCIFASSCENMPNILLEAMASGLPIACSNRGPMPEILGDAGMYFDPEQATEIADALYSMIINPSKMYAFAKLSYQRAQEYTWARCARDTFNFITDIANKKTIDERN